MGRRNYSGRQILDRGNTSLSPDPGKTQRVRVSATIIVLIVVFFLAINTECGTVDREEPTISDHIDQKQRVMEELGSHMVLEAQLEKFQSDPCGTSLYFTKLLGAWYLQARGGSALPVHRVFPHDTNRLTMVVELLGAGDDVTLTEVLRYTEECP